MDLEHAKEAWDQWEIQCLILLSLSLQFFLFLTADLRRRSTSGVLRTVLWLAYLSADTVAVFVLGHLAVHAQGPSHELMLFWAPFVLVHLGGQDSITAFSKQDNELWRRHLLGLLTQTAVAAYVVSKSSWPDARLRAAMVLMFVCGFLKYAGRTFCLFSARPNRLKNASLINLLRTVRRLLSELGDVDEYDFGNLFEGMFDADSFKEFDIADRVDDIMLVDTPVDDWNMTLAADHLQDMTKKIKDNQHRCIAYQYVAARLAQSYQVLYTKASLLMILVAVFNGVGDFCNGLSVCLIIIPIILTYTLFHCISTAIALVLFASAQKEGHHSKADITVSYILLVGAIVLDLLPAFTSIFSSVRKPFRPRTVLQCLRISSFSCIQPRGWLTKKQWSEELAQYNMTKRYSTSVECYNRCMPFIRKWIHKCKPLVGAWCVEFLDVTSTPVTDDLKLFILDRLLFLQARREEWDFANFRGEIALDKWMRSHQVTEPAEWLGYALHKSLSSRVDFPVTVLVLHIATEICYFSEDNDYHIETDETRMATTITKKKKKMSRELSQYIMYLVFKCGVMLTSNSSLVHQKAHEQLTKYFPQVNLDEKETVIKMFESIKKEDQQQGSMQQGVSQDRKMNDEVPANNDAAASSGGSGLRERLQRMLEALYSPVLPLARDVAQELIDINDQGHRWELVSEVWLEMLFYTAPRCGAAFHYEHLSTGGEFITHVLALMHRLGPFMPKPAG